MWTRDASVIIVCSQEPLSLASVASEAAAASLSQAASAKERKLHVAPQDDEDLQEVSGTLKSYRFIKIIYYGFLPRDPFLLVCLCFV